MVNLSSLFWRFRSIGSWSCWFWTLEEAVVRQGDMWVEQRHSSYVQNAKRWRREDRPPPSPWEPSNYVPSSPSWTKVETNTLISGLWRTSGLFYIQMIDTFHEDIVWTVEGSCLSLGGAMRGKLIKKESLYTPHNLMTSSTLLCPHLQCVPSSEVNPRHIALLLPVNIMYL